MFPSSSGSLNFPENSKNDFDWLVNKSFEPNVSQNVPQLNMSSSKITKNRLNTEEEYSQFSSEEYDVNLAKRPKIKSPYDKYSLPRQELKDKTSKVFSDTKSPSQDIFFVDCRSDKSNLDFDTTYYLIKPSYDSSKTIKIPSLRVKFKNENKRYFKVKKKNKGCELVVPKCKHEISSFISLNITKKISPLDGSRLAAIYDNSTHLYLTGKGPSPKTDSSETKYLSLKDESNLISEEYKLKLNTVETYNKYLNDNPHDISMWLSFIEFQNDFISTDQENSKISLENLIAEKKLSIIDKAINLNPKCTKLIIERLRIKSIISSVEENMKEWRRLTFTYPNVPSVWTSYFAFIQSNVSIFSTSRILKAFLKCFETMRNMLEGCLKTHVPPPDLEKEIIILVYKLTLLLKHNGFIEKSIAIWQALIEFNLFTPKLLNFDSNLSDWLILFEPFWDSGCPRFGEYDSKGWAQVIENKLHEYKALDDISSLEDQIFEREFDKIKIWLELEKIREKFNWLPARGSEAEEADDPARIISLDDITPILFRFRKDVTKFQLVFYFLKFLNAIDSTDEKDNMYLDDDFVNNLKIECKLSSKEHHNLFQFQDQIFLSSIKYFKDELQQKLIRMRIEFLMSKVGLISFKSVKKVIKDCLKHEGNRNDLSLWMLYANLENKNGNSQEARAVYKTAISMFTGKIALDVWIGFIRSYAEFELNIKPLCDMHLDYAGADHKESEILLILIGSIIGTKCDVITSASSLKCFKVLDMLQKNQKEYSVDVVMLKGIIYLLQSEIIKMINLFENELQKEDKEELFTSYIQLMIAYGNRTLNSYKRLKKVVEQAIRKYPNNCEFLRLHVEIQNQVGKTIDLPRFFNGTVKNNSHIIIWLFWLHSELKRLKQLQSNGLGVGIVNRIRSIFEKCLKVHREVAFIWRLYIRFEMENGDIKNIQTIIYRAIQICPWCKSLYIDGIQANPSLGKELVDIMEEKEIRLRAILQEVELLMNARNEEKPKLDD